MLNLKRLDDWPTRLAEHFDTLAGAALDWGCVDCFVCPNDAIVAMTGTDPMAPERGRYKTPIGALRSLKRHGLQSIEDYWIHILGDPLPNVKLAGRGDVVVFKPDAFVDPVDGGPLAISGVVGMDGQTVAYLDADGGIRYIELNAAKLAWRVG